MLTRRQVAAADARDAIEDMWARLQITEETLKGHNVKSTLYEHTFSAVHASLRVLGELLKTEMEKPDDGL